MRCASALILTIPSWTTKERFTLRPWSAGWSRPIFRRPKIRFATSSTAPAARTISPRCRDMSTARAWIFAKVYPGFREFVATARASRHDVFIVSHKTRFPLLGPKYDMHEAARVFLAGHMLSADDAVPGQNIFFEETKEEKISRAAALDLDVFIDDLPEILTMPGLPERCRRILFAPQRSDARGKFEQCRRWDEITALLFGARDE